MKKLKKRDYSIELLRIIACIFVISIHVSLGVMSEGRLNRSSVLASSIRADAVAIFWMITGAFLFKRDDYRKVLLSTFKKVFIPLFAMIIFIYLFGEFIFEGNNIVSSVLHPLSDVWSTITCIVLRWATPVGYTGHLWYLFVYMFIMFLFPVLKAFADVISEKKLDFKFVCIAFGLLVLNDFSNNRALGISHTVTGALVPACIFVLLGHVIYKNKEKIEKRISSCKFPIFLLVIILLRTLLYGVIYKIQDGNTDQSIHTWYSSFSVLSTSCYFFTARFIVSHIKVAFLQKCIGLLGSHTFTIYLVHGFLIGLLNKYSIIDYLKINLSNNGSLLGQLLYYSVICSLIFFSGFAISLVLKSLNILVHKTSCLVLKCKNN